MGDEYVAVTVALFKKVEMSKEKFSMHVFSFLKRIYVFEIGPHFGLLQSYSYR